MWQDLIIATITLLSGLANLVLAVYVYAKNPKSRLNKNFFYFGLAIFLWCLAKSVSLATQNLLWIRISYSIGAMVPLTGVFFAYALADRKTSRHVKMFVFSAFVLIFATTLFTPFTISNLLAYSNSSHKINFGPLFILWASYIISLTSLAIYIPINAIKKVSGQRKKQIIYFLTGEMTFAILVGIVSIILPFFGFTELTSLDTPSSIFLVGFTSYAIIKYHLMDISSLFFQAFIYSLVIVLIIAFLLSLMFISSFLFQHLLVWPIYIIVILVSIILFFIGRLFFTEKRDLEKAKINLTRMLEKSEENRIKAETERDKTSTIISSFADGLIILDEKDKIFSINPEAEKILGLNLTKDRDNLLRKPFQFLADFAKAKPIVSALIHGLSNIRRKEVKLAKDFIIELSVISLNLGRNNIGHLIVLRDVTREKFVEKMKSEFVSLAAHQLRTPLSVTKWSMSMLQKGDFGKLTKEQSEVVKNTFENNERLIFLVNDLLDVARIEEGRYLYKTEMADIAKIVSLAIDSYKDEIKEKKIKVSFEKPDNLPKIMVDAEKIRLVAQNFIDNAIKYSPAGGKVIVS
ncbi:MAG: hypothetical protein NTY81_00290, partial [Candidatus Staskawiczbacteria bacterium]|nr:hypothetical protein [Candidatus Staskawiczbacteria bacterium]